MLSSQEFVVSSHPFFFSASSENQANTVAIDSPDADALNHFLSLNNERKISRPGKLSVMVPTRSCSSDEYVMLHFEGKLLYSVIHVCK